jgi:predicted nucleic acid-binding protein
MTIGSNMICYFDTSIILSILLEETKREDAEKLWKIPSVRISSLLFNIEALTVLRRTFNNNIKKLDISWLNKKVKLLNEYCEEINLRIIDEEISKIISLKKDIAKCRTLDSIHIATALYFKSLNGFEKICLFSYDLEMINLAKKFNFETNLL